MATKDVNTTSSGDLPKTVVTGPESAGLALDAANAGTSQEAMEVDGAKQTVLNGSNRDLQLSNQHLQINTTGVGAEISNLAGFGDEPAADDEGSPSAPPRKRLQTESREGYLNSRRVLSESILKGTPRSVAGGSAKPLPVSGHSNIKRRFQLASGPQFNLEVLLKHRELQIIEEEGAKGLIALEQLRRCFLVPHPSAVSVAEAMNWPASASGADSGQTPTFAHWMPPEGLPEGPYSRHYNQWLLQDPRFHGLAPVEVPQAPYQPAQTGGILRLQNVKSQTAQCLYRRKDGVVVSLRCLDCKRENFSSPQGFINHCRIAHQRDFASHEAAAEACGTEVDEAEVANIYQPNRSARSNAASGPYQNTRHQVSSTTPAASPAPSNLGSLLGGPSTADEFSLPYAARQIPTTKSGSHRKKSNNDAATPGGGSAAQRRPASTTHLRKFLKRKNLEIEDLEGMLELTVSPVGASDSEEDFDLDEEDEDRSEMEDVVVRGMRGVPSSARMTTAARSPQKKQKSDRKSNLGRPPVNQRVVKLKISGIGRLPRFDDDAALEPPIQPGAGKDPSVIPRIPPPSELSEPSSDEDHTEDTLSSEDESTGLAPERRVAKHPPLPANVVGTPNRKRSHDDSGGITKKNRPQ